MQFSTTEHGRGLRPCIFTTSSRHFTFFKTTTNLPHMLTAYHYSLDLELELANQSDWDRDA